MSADTRYQKAWTNVEDRIDFYGRFTVDGANPFGAPTPDYGTNVVYTGVGAGTLTLTEDDGVTAAIFDEIEFAHFDLYLGAVPGAGAANIRTAVINAAAGTVTFLCEDAAGAGIEFPAAAADTQIGYHVRAKYTSTTP